MQQRHGTLWLDAAFPIEEPELRARLIATINASRERGLEITAVEPHPGFPREIVCVRVFGKDITIAWQAEALGTWIAPLYRSVAP